MKKTRIALLLVAAVLVASAGIAQAALITNVVRANGQSGDRAPIGVYNGATAPLPMPVDGLQDIADNDHTVFSDRTYPWINSPAELIGSEYIRMFNNDKASSETDVTYTVTISQACTVWVTIDDRVPAEWTAFASQQAAVDDLVSAFAAAGTFTDTGLNLFIKENSTTNRPMSVYSANLQAGTYVFGDQPHNKNFYTIGAIIPEPTTLLLLGLGGLIASRKRS